MKHTIFVSAAVIIFALAGCNGQAKQNGESKSGTTTGISELKTAETSASVIGAPVHITKADFLKLVMDYEVNKEVWKFNGQKPCLIDFYADWCAPCRITSPILEELAGVYAGKINVYKVDIDKEQELAAVFGIQSIPTFLFCPMQGNPTISSGIANSPEATRDMFVKQIEELLLKNGSSPAL